MSKRFTYNDETDRSYGLTGMAVTMAVWSDNDEILDIDIDRTDEPVAFTPGFYFSGNPSCSAKDVWEMMTRHFQLAMGMAQGNLLCRRLVGQNVMPADDEADALRNAAEEEGLEVCGLEKDEVDALWNKSYRSLVRVFGHSGVGSIAGHFASELRSRRRLERSEIAELLRDLARL